MRLEQHDASSCCGCVWVGRGLKTVIFPSQEKMEKEKMVKVKKERERMAKALQWQCTMDESKLRLMLFSLGIGGVRGHHLTSTG